MRAVSVFNTTGVTKRCSPRDFALGLKESPGQNESDGVDKKN